MSTKVEKKHGATISGLVSWIKVNHKTGRQRTLSVVNMNDRDDIFFFGAAMNDDDISYGLRVKTSGEVGSI